MINVPARAIGDKTIGVVRAFVAREGIPYWLGLERAAEGEIPELAGRARAAIAEFVGLIRRLRSRVGVLPLPELLDDVLERSGLPGDARGRHGGGRGALGEPPRAARGHDALRRPVRGGRARPAARGDRARRRPGQLPVGRGHAVADHACTRPRAWSSRSCSSPGWRSRSSRRAAPSRPRAASTRTRARWRRSGVSPTWA